MPHDLRSAAGTTGAGTGGYVRTKPRRPMLSTFARARSGSNIPSVLSVSDRSAPSSATSTSSSGTSGHHPGTEAAISPSASMSSSTSDWWRPLLPASSYHVHHGRALTNPNPSRPTSLTASDSHLQSTSSDPAISSLFDNNHFKPSSRDDFPVNYNPFPPEQPVEQALTITNGLLSNGNSDGLRQLSPTDNALTDVYPSPRALPLTDLLTHHDLPRSLPPLPCTGPSTPANQSPPSPTVRSDVSSNISALSASYMSMLSQTPPPVTTAPSATTCSTMITEVDCTTSADAVRQMQLEAFLGRGVFPESEGVDISEWLIDIDDASDVSVSGQDDQRADTTVSLSFDKFFEEQTSFTKSPFDEDIDAILRSAGAETPSTAFPTPALGYSPGSVMDPSPAMNDIDDDHLPFAMPLFGVEPPQQPCTEDKDTSTSALGLNILEIEGLIGITSTPQIGIVPIPSPPSAVSTLPSLPSPTTFPPSASYAEIAPSTPAVASSDLLTAASTSTFAQRKVTGHRRNVTPASLVPVDAPTQSRSYIKPSATSRKVIPAAFQSQSKKRASSTAFGDEDEMDPMLEDAIQTKRRQNTVAARRSRARKLEYVRELERTVEKLKGDLSEALLRAEQAEERVRTLGNI